MLGHFLAHSIRTPHRKLHTFPYKLLSALLNVFDPIPNTRLSQRSSFCVFVFSQGDVRNSVLLITSISCELQETGKFVRPTDDYGQNGFRKSGVGERLHHSWRLPDYIARLRFTKGQQCLPLIQEKTFDDFVLQR